MDNNVDLLEVIAGEDGGTSGLGRFETVTGCLTTVDNLAASWTCAYHFYYHFYYCRNYCCSYCSNYCCNFEFQNIIIQIFQVRHNSAKILKKRTDIKKCTETKRIICLLNEIFLLMDSSEGLDTVQTLILSIMYCFARTC